MAIYRLESYPDAPRRMQGKAPRFAFWLGAALLAAAACVPLMLHAHALADRLRLPAEWLGNAIAVLFGLALIAALLCALLLLHRRKYLLDYGRQECELTPEGLTYSGPGQPARFTPADALLSFSVRRGRTCIKAAEPCKGALLPSELANRDALWNELRLMGVPELPARSPWASFGKLMLALVPLYLCLIAASSVQAPAAKLLLCAPFVLFMVRAQWTIARRDDGERSPWKQQSFYLGIISSALLALLFLLPWHKHRNRP